MITKDLLFLNDLLDRGIIDIPTMTLFKKMVSGEKTTDREKEVVIEALEAEWLKMKCEIDITSALADIFKSLEWSIRTGRIGIQERYVSQLIEAEQAYPSLKEKATLKRKVLSKEFE